MNVKSEWLNSLKPNDKVALRYDSMSTYPNYIVHIIDRVTATQIILDNTERFRKKDGRAIGRSSISTPKLLPYTDEIKMRIQFVKLVNETGLLLDKVYILIKDGIEPKFKNELETLFKQLTAFKELIEKRE